MSPLKRFIISVSDSLSCSFSSSSSLGVFRFDSMSSAIAVSINRDPSAIAIKAMADNAWLNVNMYWTTHAITYPNGLFVSNGNLKSDLKRTRKMNSNWENFLSTLIVDTYHMRSGNLNASAPTSVVKKVFKLINNGSTTAQTGNSTSKPNLEIRVHF